MKISTISSVLGYTLDTYSTFSWYEALSEEDVTEETELDDFEGYRRELAELQVHILNRAVESDNIIAGFKLEGSYSPREYNFSTDNSELEVEFNSKKLLAYVNNNLNKFGLYLNDNFTSRSGFSSFVPNNWSEFKTTLYGGDEIDRDRNWGVMVGWYMDRAVLTEEEYLDEMYDNWHEIVYNHAINLAEVEA